MDKASITNMFDTLIQLTNSIESVVPVLMVCFGLMPMLYTWVNAIRLKLKLVKSVVGTIEHSSIAEEVPYQTSEGAGTHYRPDISYSYIFDDTKYSSDNIYGIWGSFSANDKSKALQVVKKFPVGMAVTVYLSDKNPKASYLELAPPMGFLMFICSIFVAMGLLIFAI